MIDRVKDKLSGKRVLLITARFYHYGDAICEKIKTYGAKVSHYYERDLSIRHNIIASFFSNRMDGWQDRHYRNILSDISDCSFDYLIVVRGYKMKSWFVEAIKRQNPGIYSIMYQWDPYTAWESDYRHLMPLFDRTLSFDYHDSKTLNIPYSPTFHTDEYSAVPKSPSSYDFIFCTSYTDEKYAFLKSFKRYCQQKGYTLKSHLYISWLRFIKARFSGTHISKKDISFRRLPRELYFELFCKSKTIVDFSASTQTGLTMRVIDALGSGKRVLTNNANAVNEPSFNPRQIILYDSNDLAFPEWVADDEWFEVKDYSIDKWLDNLFFA